MSERGAGMAADIAEQPEVYARLLEPSTAAAIADRRQPDRRQAARGTSCSPRAARPTTPRSTARTSPRSASASRPVSPSPSAVTVYGARPDLSDALVIGVSQSGGSHRPGRGDAAARECRGADARVTNNPASPLAEAAELHIDVAAGHERAVAATKTYTAELLALLHC